MRGFILGAILLAGTAHADVIVEFREGAPKDRFTITNTSDCATGPVEITFDLSTAPAGLIFDVTDAGAGVEVFQPFELISGEDMVTSASALRDGDQSLVLALTDLAPAGEIGFTTDLDDTGGGREITVSGSEIAGAMVQVSSDVGMAEGAFEDTSVARVPIRTCAS